MSSELISSFIIDDRRYEKEKKKVLGIVCYGCVHSER